MASAPRPTGRRPSGGGGLRRRALEAPPIRGLPGGGRSTGGRRGRSPRLSWPRLSFQELGGGGPWRLPGCLDLLGRPRMRQSSPLVSGTGCGRVGVVPSRRIIVSGRACWPVVGARRYQAPGRSVSLDGSRVVACKAPSGSTACGQSISESPGHMRAAVVPVPERAAIARAAASGAAPTLPLASEGDPTTHGASCGAAAQSGKRKRDEEPVVRAPSFPPNPVVAAPSQRAVHPVVALMSSVWTGSAIRAPHTIDSGSGATAHVVRSTWHALHMQAVKDTVRTQTVRNMLATTSA
eukprot:scaffold33165_cov144-Isochrysis_galbana.AAC.2